MSDLKNISTQLRESVKMQLEGYEKDLAQALDDEAKAVEKLQSKEAKGDTSENSTYQEAHDAYMKAQQDIATYSTRIDLLKQFDLSYTPSNVIDINTTVSFTLVDYEGKYSSEYIMLIVPAGLGNAERNLLDINSPIGKALYKHKVNRNVQYPGTGNPTDFETITYTSLSGVKKLELKEIY